MNPVVVIPTYISASKRVHEGKGVVANYDHTTSLSDSGELGRCLESLKIVDGLGVVMVLVCADPNIDMQAYEKVCQIADQYPELDVLVIGSKELEITRRHIEDATGERLAHQIGLRGYGATRNFGLLLANVMGFDAVVFLDDDEVVEDEDFLAKAMYGLGRLTKKGIPILAKTGYYLNDKDSYLSKWEDAWYNRFWQQGKAFNEWIEAAMAGPRLSRSNRVCGGCLAVHKEAFRRLAFDPWIPRGEDLDYMINLRLYGSEIWFDNEWWLRHLPPKTKNEGNRFRQDIFRWLYEHDKLEYSNSLIDLQKVTPHALDPYPGPFLEKGIRNRIRITALLRSIVKQDKRAYRQAAKVATGEATRYAHENCSKYFEFQYIWPDLMSRFDTDAQFTQELISQGEE